jgi:hypothetical protein
MPVELYERKWHDKATARIKALWVKHVQAAESFEAFVKGLSAALDIPESTVRSSLPAVSWKEFQSKADQYLPILLNKIEAAYGARKWSTGMRRAFSTPP